KRVDRDLETVCLKCLQKEPQQRYGSALAVAEDLERWLRAEPIHARPGGPLERAARGGRPHPAMSTPGAPLVVLLGAGVTGLITSTLLLAGKEAEAQRQKEVAEGQRALAQEGWQTVRRQLYVAYINQAHRAWQAGDLSRARDLLDQLAPVAGL